MDQLYAGGAPERQSSEIVHQGAPFFRGIRVYTLHIRNKVCTVTNVDVQSTLQCWWGLVGIGGGWKWLEIEGLGMALAISPYP